MLTGSAGDLPEPQSGGAGGSWALSAPAPCSGPGDAHCRAQTPPSRAEGEENPTGAKGKGRMCQNRAWGGRGLSGGEAGGGTVEVLGLDHRILSLLRARRQSHLSNTTPYWCWQEKFNSPWAKRLVSARTTGTRWSSIRLPRSETAPSFRPAPVSSREGRCSQKERVRQAEVFPSLSPSRAWYLQAEPHLSRV